MRGSGGNVAGLFDRFLHVEKVSALVGGQLSYSVLDLAIVTMLVLVAAQSKGRAGSAYSVLGLGALVFLATNLASVKMLAGDGYPLGTMLDAGWPAGVLLLGLASRFGTSLRSVGALRGRYLYGAVSFSFAVGVGLLVVDTLAGHDSAGHSPIITGLAVAILVLIREELLVRMVDPHGDKVPPAAFLPAAERFGLIQEIDLLVLGKAIEMVESGRPVAVNISARSLTDPRYLDTLESALGTGLEPSDFNFEITETAAVANMSDAQDFAARIRELGCSLALDDFGTGFSSFTYLKHIPTQFLKIDIEFIRELQRNPADRQLVEAIVSIARGLGQKTVAEGVEDGETLEIVRRLGVDLAQGFHIGRPVPTGAQRGGIPRGLRDGELVKSR